MKRLIVALSLVALSVGTAFAMPTKEELSKAQPVVKARLQKEIAALKKAKKPSSAVAEAALRLAEESDSEAEKLLYIKGAFGIYLKDKDEERALEALKILQQEIPDIPSENVVNIYKSALKGKKGKTGSPLKAYVDKVAVGEDATPAGDFPRIVKIFPANGDMNVNPKTDKIVITFDRPMDGGYAFARGIGANWNHHPETTGKPTWNKKMTQITFPVKLRSGWEYVASLNREGCESFCSVNGKPLQGVRYAFRTSGKTEPLDNVPHIVKIEPANGAKNVSVSLKAIRVTFDRKMQDGCFSVCRSNDGTWEDYPKLAGKISYDKSCKILTIPVSLVPGKTYKLQFNNGEACALMDTKGHSLEDYPYSFTTEGGALMRHKRKELKAMRKIVMLIGVVAALVTQAEPKFADLLAKAKAGDAEAMCGVARCYSHSIPLAVDAAVGAGVSRGERGAVRRAEGEWRVRGCEVKTGGC